MRTVRRRATWVGTAIVVLGLVAGCGGSSRPSSAGTATGRAGGGLGDVPVFGQMHPLGQAQQSHGVTSRTYTVGDLSAQTAMTAFVRTMRGTTWRESVALHRVGTQDWQAAWTRSGYRLVASAIAAPTLQHSGDGTTQLSLQLYPPGTTPST